MYPQIIELLGRYPARSVLPHGEKMSLNNWLAILLVMVSQKIPYGVNCLLYWPISTQYFPTGLVKT